MRFQDPKLALDLFHFQDLYFTRCEKYAQKCIFSLEKQMSLCFCYRRMFIVWFHWRARDMASSLFYFYISSVSIYFTILVHENVFKMQKTERRAKEKYFKFILFMAFIRRCYYS